VDAMAMTRTGLAVILNPYTNPSFEVDVLAVLVDTGLAKVQSSAEFWKGTKSLKVTSSQNFPPIKVVRFVRRGTDDRFPVVPGQDYTWSFAIKPDAVTTLAGHIGIKWFDSDGVVIIPHPFTQITLVGGDGWVRFSISAEAPSNAATAELNFEETVAWNSGDIIYIDGCNFTSTAVLQDYIDGDQFECDWGGTPHISASARQIPVLVPAYGRSAEPIPEAQAVEG